VLSIPVSRLIRRAVLLAGLLFMALPTAPAREALVMGVFPRYGLRGTIEHFTPLADYLSRHLQRPVEVRSAPNFALFQQELERGAYDILHVNQYHYVRAHQRLGYEVIAMNEEGGRATIAGTLVVRGDSGITTVSQLRGRRIVFGGGERAMQSYIIATWLLREAGLGEGDYLEEFARSPVNAIFAAYFGQADAAGVGEPNLQKRIVTRRIDTAELRVLARGPALAHLPWAVRRDLPAALRQRIRSLLVNLRHSAQGRAVLKAAELTALRPATDADYDPHRRIIAQVLGEAY